MRKSTIASGPTALGWSRRPQYSDSSNDDSTTLVAPRAPKSVRPGLWNQGKLALCAAAFYRAMRGTCFMQRKMCRLQCAKPPFFNAADQFSRATLHFHLIFDIRKDRSPSHPGALEDQRIDLDVRSDSGCLSIGNGHSSRCQRLYCFGKGGCTHCVKRDVNTPSVRYREHCVKEMTIAVIHRVVSTDRTDGLQFFLRGSRSDDDSPHAFKPLNKELAYAAGGSVHQGDIAGFDGPVLGEQILGRDALKKQCFVGCERRGNHDGL